MIELEERGHENWGVAQDGEDGDSGGETLLERGVKVNSEGGILD